MGEVEQIRMAAPGITKVDTLTFRPDPDVERALKDSVETAQRNLNRYLARVKEAETK